MLQTFQQQPAKPETNTSVHTIQTQAQHITTGLGMAPLQPPQPTQTAQQKAAFDKVAVCLFIFIRHQQLNVLWTVLFRHLDSVWSRSNLLC